MRIYSDNNRKELVSVICNQCKKKLKVENGIVKEGCFFFFFQQGNVSNKDGMEYRFDLCAACYDKMTAGFAIPVEEEEAKELLQRRYYA